jgi:hypothetical protein
MEIAMAALEKHYTCKEISQLWGFSVGVVRSIFKDRADVLRVGHGEGRYARAYVSLRIPESVIQKVHAELRAKKVSQ